MKRRLIPMRCSRLVILVLVLTVPLLAGCGEQATDDSGDRSGITGRVLLGPQCPVEVEGEPCPDEPAAGAEVTVAERVPGDPDALGEVVARTTTDAEGGYRVDVPPGEYVVTSDAGMSCELRDARVTSGVYSEIVLPCDTGIR